MLLFGSVAISGARVPCSFSGTFTATGAGPTVDSATRTVTVPLGNSGQITISNQVETGAVTFTYSHNGGAHTNAEVNPTTITMANGDTLLFRIASTALGESEEWDLTDVTTGTAIGATYSLTDTT